MTVRSPTNKTRALINPPTEIEYGNARFLIIDAPSQSNLGLYIEEFKKYNVTDVVRCCEPTYSAQQLEQRYISVHDLVFADGEAPPNHIIEAWLDLVDRRFGPQNESSEKVYDKAGTQPCIATHCVAGLGRAPVLVAIALIEQGMSPLDSVVYIRERRRGAINNKQLKFIESYKRRSKSKSRCVIC